MLIDVTKQMGNEIRKSAIPLELPGVGLQDCQFLVGSIGMSLQYLDTELLAVLSENVC
jgi:hypothetical protein